MGKKEPKKPDTARESDAVSAPPSIFNTLFGDADGQNGAVSIFSDDNPFRRKPHEDGPLPEEAGTREDAGSARPDAGELQKRKRSVGNAHSSSLDGEALLVALGVKKSKKGELQNPSSENPNLGPEVQQDEVLAKKRDKKKRKRDELERAYEARKYGAVENPEDGEKGLGGEVVGKKRKALDNPADMLVSKEGYDDESKLLRTIFVGNLPLKIKKKALIREFSKFGEVESVRIRSVPISEVGILAKNLIFRV